MSSEELSNSTIIDSEVQLPRYIKLTTGTLMRLRSFPLVMRYHRSQKKEGHEQHYAELLLFYHWRDEEGDLFCNNATECVFHTNHEK